MQSVYVELVYSVSDNPTIIPVHNDFTVPNTKEPVKFPTNYKPISVLINELGSCNRMNEVQC